jgi:uracil-DNA glycosylase family 4
MNPLPVCTKCPLHENAKNVLVESKGSDDPTILFVGLAASYAEDKTGVAFSGKHGKKLDELIEEAGIDTDSCRFTQLVRCTPWKNSACKGVRDPTEAELATCSNYLLKELQFCQPDIIVPLGKQAAMFFLPHLGDKLKITKISGAIFNWNHPTTDDEYTVMPTLAPSALAKSDHWLPKVMEAFRNIKNVSTGKTAADIFADCDYQYLDTLEKVEAYVDMVIEQYDPDDWTKAISVDAETGFKAPLPEDYEIEPLEIALNPYNPYHIVVSVQLSHAPKKGALIPLWHKDSPFKDYYSIMAIGAQIQRLVDVVPVLGQNFKFDWQVLYACLGVEVKAFLYDSMLAHYLLYQKSRPMGLEDMAGAYVDMPFFKQEMHKALDTLPPEIRHMGNVDLDKLIRYGCGDSDAVYRLYLYWRPILEDNGLWEVYVDILQQATISFSRIETNGMLIDPERLEKLRVDYAKELDELLRKIRTSDYVKELEEVLLEKHYEKVELKYAKENAKRVLDGKPPVKRKKWTPQQEQERELKVRQKLRFKPSSPDQLRLLFYDEHLMDFSSDDKGLTKAKQISADKNARELILQDAHQEIELLKEKQIDDEETVEALNECIWVVESINEWVGKNKLHSAYIKSAPKLLPDKEDLDRAWPIPLPPQVCAWCFHANFKIHGTDTGRLSCEHPNLQQMPFKSLIKWMFISRWKSEGGVLLQGDYSQAELRVLAKLCDEKEMLAAFNRGEDIHMFVATLVFGALGVPADQITKAMRRIAKRASFGIVYGQGAKALAKGFGTSIDEAKEIIRTLYKVFPNLRGWMDEKKQQAIDEGLVTTPMGRLRWIKGADSRDEYTAAEAGRKAVNTPIQSAASDWTLCALNEIQRRFVEEGFKSLIVATIHDSIMVDVYPGELLKVMELMHYEMVVNLPERFDWIKGVTPKTDFEFGVDWKAMTDIEQQPDLTYKVKGEFVDIKKNLTQLYLCGEVDQLDAFIDADSPEDSWALLDLVM